MRRCRIWAVCLTLVSTAWSVAEAEPRHILLLNSFERGSAAENQFAGMLRIELGRQSSEAINFFEVSLQPALTPDNSAQGPVVEYLRATFASRQLDLVVSLGGPAAAFVQRFRAELFPETPLLLAAVDRRSIREGTATAYETAIPVATDATRIVEDILRLLPDTRTLFIVIGASRIEDFWRGELSRMLAPYQDRLALVWSNELTLADMLKRSSTLPPNSAIFYTLFSEDGSGAMQSEERTLTELHAVANAPLFGLYDIQLDRGIVGGSLLSVEALTRSSASVIVRILRGESPSSIKTPPLTHGQPTFDWRELQRWGISETRLPVGSVVRFRQPSAWQQYRGYLVGAAVILALQSAMIAGLVVQRARRRRVERELRESEQRFRLMANGAPVMVWTARPDMATDFFNTTVLEFSGLTMEQLVGDGWVHRLHPDDVDRYSNIYVAAHEARRLFRMEYRFRRADDTYRWVLDTGIPRYGPDGAFAGYIGSALDITERREMEQSLLDQQAALRRAVERNQDLAGRLINAQEAERTRIARDLHDDVSQQLAGIAIMLSGLRRELGASGLRPEVQEGVSALQKQTSSLADAIRELSHELHPGVLKHAGLVPALKQYCEAIDRHHAINVDFSPEGNFADIDFDVALCLYRVTQEALGNVLRHARARTVLIELRRAGIRVHLSVIDDGIGFVAGERSASSLGLRSIDERVRLVGGVVTIESQPGRGTSLLVGIPIEATAQAEIIG